MFGKFLLDTPSDFPGGGQVDCRAGLRGATYFEKVSPRVPVA